MGGERKSDKTGKKNISDDKVSSSSAIKRARSCCCMTRQDANQKRNTPFRRKNVRTICRDDTMLLASSPV